MESDDTGLFFDHALIEVNQIQIMSVLKHQSISLLIEILLSSVHLISHDSFGPLHRDQLLTLKFVILRINQHFDAFLEHVLGRIDCKNLLFGHFSQTIYERDFGDTDVFCAHRDRFDILDEVDDVLVGGRCPLFFFKGALSETFALVEAMGAEDLLQACCIVMAARIGCDLLHTNDFLPFAMITKRVQLKLTQVGGAIFRATKVLRPFSKYLFHSLLRQRICINYFIELLNCQVWVISDFDGQVAEAS